MSSHKRKGGNVVLCSPNEQEVSWDLSFVVKRLCVCGGGGGEGGGAQIRNSNNGGTQNQHVNSCM